MFNSTIYYKANKEIEKITTVRIAFITYEYPPETVTGGIGTYTKQVASLLASSNMIIHVFAGSHIQTGKVVESNITVHRIACTGPHDFQQNVLSYFEEEHLDNAFELIESPEIHANALAIKKRFPTLPLVVRLHACNWIVENYKKKYMPVTSKLHFFLGALRRGRWDLGYWRSYNYKNDVDYGYVQQADFISAPSIEMKNWTVQNWKIDKQDITVVENPFVENEAFKNARTKNKEHAIIFYGRLNVLKGLITATKAMKRILKYNPEWKWIIVGNDGTAADGKTSMKHWMQNELKEQISQVEFYDTVAHEAIPFYLQRASIVLIPSLFESYSYVTIEAMCAGKAIIGSKDTGIASLIKNNVSGILVNAYKVNEWVTHIQQLINNKELRKKLGKAAYENAAIKHIVNEEIVEYYKEMTLSKKFQY